MTTQPASPAPSLEQALRFQQAGRTIEAEALFRDVLRENPANAAALHSLAIILGDKGQIEHAQLLVEEAIAVNAQEPQYYRTLAKIYVLQQQYSKAIEAFRASLYIQPLQTEALSDLAKTFEKQEDVYAAICYYKQALEQNDAVGETHFSLAKCLFKAGFSEEAVRHFARAHTLLPFSCFIMEHYANALIVAGRLEEAAAVLQYAFAYFPSAPLLLHLQGIVHFRLDAFEEGLLCYERALGFQPDNRTLLVDYAVCLRTLGDDKSAEKVLKRVGHLARNS